MQHSLKILWATVIGMAGFDLSMPLAYSQESAAIRFVPRDDEYAVSDLEKLRYALSQSKDALGNIDPLASYAKPAQPRKIENAPPRRMSSPREDDSTSRERDSEAESKPRLPAGSTNAYETPRLAWQSSVDIQSLITNIPARNQGTSPSRSSNTDRSSEPNLMSDALASNRTQPVRTIGVDDGFRPTRMLDDREASYIPTITNDVVYASATVPVSFTANYSPSLTTPIASDRISRFQEIPYGSQGTPVLPNVGGMNPYPSNPVLPNPPVYPPTTTYPPSTIPSGTYPPGTYPPGTYPPITNAPPVSTIPSYPVNPPSYPLNPYVPPLTTTVPPSSVPPTSILTAPPATYIPAVVPVIPSYPSAPIASIPSAPLSPISSIPSAYESAASSIVNYKPFVSGPPRQFDARSMVSPTLFRPELQSCNTCASPGTYAPGTYAPGTMGNPMSYVPPTNFPYPYGIYNTSYRPLVGFGQDISKAQLGRGIIGQPTAYMQNQPVRNIFRYLFP